LVFTLLFSNSNANSNTNNNITDTNILVDNGLMGSTKGEANINQGDFTYKLDIKTPKGISGLNPNLSINYNSASNMNSILGKSFALGGLGSISKCNENLFKEKQDNKRDYNYCLNGQKLLLVDPSNIYGSTNSEYKTAINTQSKIIKKANHWEVYTKDGLIYEYGNDEMSSDDSNQNSAEISNENPNSKLGDAIYKLTTIKDRYSNQIRYYYHPNNHDVSNSIKKI
jgi:hypothetical protein